MSIDVNLEAQTGGATASPPGSCGHNCTCQSSPDPADALDRFLVELLAEQQTLQTPVTRFSEHHDRQSEVPAMETVYRDLIPLTAPGPGEQYAFEVDLDACSGCKACVSGCHSLNGLDDHETWRDVGLVVGGDITHPFQQTITSACHHCADPGCLNGCPVVAYEKDPVTGIVRHLDDQCIGCSYCVLKCPYDVPKYNKRLGIVRKCDMCHGRLSQGEAPACVQSCPTHAIKIVKVTLPEARKADTTDFLSVAPDPSYTQPTSRFVTKKKLPDNLVSADARLLRPQHTHWALVFLLTLTQAGIGISVSSNQGSVAAWTGALLFLSGLIASVAHLGQPMRAWRVFLGLRTSWLSREAVVLGAAFGPILLWIIPRQWLPFTIPEVGYSAIKTAILMLGTLGVFCSAMIYVDTRRQFWRISQSLGRMFGTVVIGSLALVHTPLAGLFLITKILMEASTLRGDGASARLQLGPLSNTLLLRMGLAFAAVLVSGLSSWIFLPLFLLGEVFERALFFSAVDSPKMPGSPAIGNSHL